MDAGCGCARRAPVAGAVVASLLLLLVQARPPAAATESDSAREGRACTCARTRACVRYACACLHHAGPHSSCTGCCHRSGWLGQRMHISAWKGFALLRARKRRRARRAPLAAPLPQQHHPRPGVQSADARAIHPTTPQGGDARWGGCPPLVPARPHRPCSAAAAPQVVVVVVLLLLLPLLPLPLLLLPAGLVLLWPATHCAPTPSRSLPIHRPTPSPRTRAPSACGSCSAAPPRRPSP